MRLPPIFFSFLKPTCGIYPPSCDEIQASLCGGPTWGDPHAAKCSENMILVLVWSTYIPQIFNAYSYIQHQYIDIPEDFKVHSVFY